MNHALRLPPSDASSSSFSYRSALLARPIEVEGTERAGITVDNELQVRSQLKCLLINLDHKGIVLRQVGYERVKKDPTYDFSCFNEKVAAI